MQMKKIGMILIIMGIIIVMIPVAGGIYTKYQQNKLLREFREQLDSQLAEGTVNESVQQDYSELDDIFKDESTQSEAPETTGSNTAGSVTPEETESSVTETSETTAEETEETKEIQMIGTLQIKKLKIDVIVVEGIGDADLKVGVGHFPGTAGIGEEGNCAIAGHRSYTFGKFFNRLNEVAVGDEIIVSNGIEDFKYIVYKVFVVEPSDTYVLNQVEGYRILTLITCEPIYVATHRLIIQAKIEE
jgi:sortase A